VIDKNINRNSRHNHAQSNSLPELSAALSSRFACPEIPWLRSYIHAQSQIRSILLYL